MSDSDDEVTAALSQKMARESVIRARVRQQAIRRMCHGGDGKLTKDARLMTAYLNRFCNGSGQLGPPRVPATGAIDPHAMAQAVGRREVFDLLARLLSVTLEDRHNSKEDL